MESVVNKLDDESALLTKEELISLQVLNPWPLDTLKSYDQWGPSALDGRTGHVLQAHFDGLKKIMYC